MLEQIFNDLEKNTMTQLFMNKLKYFKSEHH